MSITWAGDTPGRADTAQVDGQPSVAGWGPMTAPDPGGREPAHDIARSSDVSAE